MLELLPGREFQMVGLLVNAVAQGNELVPTINGYTAQSTMFEGSHGVGGYIIGCGSWTVVHSSSLRQTVPRPDLPRPEAIRAIMWEGSL